MAQKWNMAGGHFAGHFRFWHCAVQHGEGRFEQA
jgi:hypothetical protein